jgi:hypothetical protein
MNFLSLFPSLDLFILFLFLVAVLMHLLFIRKDRLFTHILSVYVSFALIILVPMFSPTVLNWLATHYWLRAVAFVALYLVLSLVVLRFSNLGSISQMVTPSKFITSLVYRVAIIGLLFTTVLYFLPNNIKSIFGNIVHVLFINLLAMFIWFVIPLVFAFAYRFKTRRGWIE